MRGLRIAYIINTLELGGAERLVTALAGRMTARGHSVVIVTLGEKHGTEMPVKGEARFLGIRRNPASALPGYFRAMRLLRAFQPDVLHSHNFHGNILARALRICFPRARIVSTIHNVHEGGRLRMMALRATDALSRCSVAVSRAAGERAVKAGAVPRHKCSVIANGIDAAEFAPDAMRRATMRGLAGVGDGFLWLAAGRLVPAKDYPNLLRAFAEVRAEAKGAQLWIAGDGNAAYADALRALAVRLDLEDDVQWLGARLDMPALLDAADGFALASAWEGMPMALGEAMAMEKIAVATDVGGVGELAGECAAIVPPGDSAALGAAMLRQMRASAESRAEMGRAARRRIVEQFNMDAKAEEWEAMYRSVLARDATEGRS